MRRAPPCYHSGAASHRTDTIATMALEGAIPTRAMVLHRFGRVGTGLLRPEDRPDPQPGPGQVALRVRACGVCHTDLHLCQGELPDRRLPIIPGHQIVAEVAALGTDMPATADLRPGQRVGVGWLHQACGNCRFCRTGRENLCPQIAFTGYDRDGGYAQVALAPAAYVYPLPDTFDDAQAAPLLCAGIIGWRAIARAGIAPGERVGLFGFGASAHLALQVLKAWGCAVAVFSRGSAHLALAASLGADWTGTYAERGPWPLERAVVFTPAGETVLEALSRLDAGGVVAIASVHLSPIPAFDHDALLLGEREIRSVTAATRADALDFLTLAGRLRPRVQVQEWPLERAEDALVALAAGRVEGAAVLRPT